MWEAPFVSIYRVLQEPELESPALVAALNGRVDAGAAGTTAASYLASDGEIIVELDTDALADCRARSPTLDRHERILTGMARRELTLRSFRADHRDPPL